MEELRKYIGDKEKAYIRTRTQFEAVRLLTNLDTLGYGWIDGDTIDVGDTGWVHEGENTVYYLDIAFGIVSLSDIKSEPDYKEFSELVVGLKDKNMKSVLLNFCEQDLVIIRDALDLFTDYLELAEEWAEGSGVEDGYKDTATMLWELFDIHVRELREEKEDD